MCIRDSHQDLPQGPFVLELHLGFGGMDIYINCVGFYLEIDKVIGTLAGRDQRLVGRHDRLMEEGMADVPVVDKEELVGSSLPCVLRG